MTLRNIKVFLNSQMYPYDELELDYTENLFLPLYEMYASFQYSYYGKQKDPALTPNKFKTIAPLVVIDCSKQNEGLNIGGVDIRIEFETADNIPANTYTYALLVHDKSVSYNVLSGGVNKASMI